jgi:hypothetical protein
MGRYGVLNLAVRFGATLQRPENENRGGEHLGGETGRRAAALPAYSINNNQAL